MSEEIRKSEQQEEIADLDLDTVAGGSVKDIDGVDVIIQRKPAPGPVKRPSAG